MKNISKILVANYIPLLIGLLLSINTYSQNLGISDAGASFTPNSSAVLELLSTTRGFLAPRMTTAQRNAISSPVEGLIIYNTDIHSFDIYNASNFNSIGYGGSHSFYIGSGAGATLSTGTDNIFLGYNAGNATNSNYNIMLGSYAGKSNTNSGDVFIGYQAGYSATGSVDQSVFIGYLSGYTANWGKNVFVGAKAGRLNNSSAYNLYVGHAAGENNDAAGNVFIGSEAGNASTAVGGAVLIGYQAGMYNLTNANWSVYIGNAAGKGVSAIAPATGADNVFIGNSVALNHTSGSRNVLTGTNAGYSLTSGNDNSVMGYKAGYNLAGGNNNEILGSLAGYNLTSGSDNIYIGYQAGYTNSTASGNICIGTNAGYNLTSGTNTFIGYNAGYNSVAQTGNVFIGYNAGSMELTSNKLYFANSNTTTPLIYGEFDNKLVRFNGTLLVKNSSSSSGSISFLENASNGSYYTTITPNTSLSSDMIYTLPSADGASGQILTSDASGNLGWAPGTPQGGIETLPYVFPNVASFLGNKIPTYVAVFCKKSVTVSTIAIYISAIATSSNFDVGIYDASATNNKLISTGSFAVTTTGLKTQALSGSLVLTAGNIYYLAIEELDNNTGTTVFCYNNPPAGDTFFTFLGTTAVANLQATEATHSTSNKVPWIGAY